jgi:hypothetical protein
MAESITIQIVVTPNIRNKVQFVIAGRSSFDIGRRAPSDKRANHSFGYGRVRQPASERMRATARVRAASSSR